MELSDYGWNARFQAEFASLALEAVVPARVVADFGTSLKIATPEIITAELSGKLAHYTDRQSAPKVGDWVAARQSGINAAVIEAVVPRRSEIARKVAGKQTIKQVIAANVDVAFVLLALDGDFSVERLKRFLYQLSINSIRPVIVLNKADKTTNLSFFQDQLSELQLPIVITIATTGQGIDELVDHIGAAQTAILLGSSGVGKSTLTNHLLGRLAQATQAVRRSDATGQHTTVHRELFVLPGGGLLIDTPGIRELQLWGSEAALDENFDDVVMIATNCQYKTCRHGTELGCAIKQALASGQLARRHYSNYLKMKAELTNLNLKNTVRQARANQRSRQDKSRQARDQARDDREQMA